MTQYTVWLWPGFGVELKPFTVDAFSEQDALETVGQSLKGSALTLDPDEFFEKVQELEIDGYSEDEAVEQLYQEWFPVNGGEFYLNILNARIEQVPETSANRRARTGSRSPKVNDPLGFTKGIMPKNPPKAYVAAIRFPDGSVRITHEFPRDYLLSVVVPDALEVQKGCTLEDVFPLDQKEAWIKAHTKKTASPNSKAKAKKKGIFGSRNVRFAEDLPRSVSETFPMYIPGDTITMPSGEVMDVVGEVNLLDGQTDGEVSCYTEVIDADGEWWDVAFTFTLDYFMRTPKERLDWSGHISDVLHNPDMSPSMNRKSTGRRGR